MSAPSLQRRLLVGVLGYLALLSVALVVHGLFVNEQAEQVVLDNLLNVEMDQTVARLREGGVPEARRGPMRLYDGAAASLPRGLQGLPPGLHDDLDFEGREHVVLVRDALGRRLVLALDLSDFEREEARLTLAVAASSLALVMLLALALAASIRRMLRPLGTLADDIGALAPGPDTRRLQPPGNATRELGVIADAFNAYLDRQALFVRREREFLHTASHELRTPVAVIAHASELALASPSLASPAREQVARIAATCDQVAELLALLLVLARDPERIGAQASAFDLAALLAALADDHRHLLAGRELTLRTELPAAMPARLPEPVLRAVVGNLLRNAIEHSGRGEVVLALDAGGIRIDDPGQHMSAEEIGARYASAARDPATAARGGIGLPLIARLCEHMHWTLEFREQAGGGTQTRLVLGQGSDVPGPPPGGPPHGV